MSESYDRISDDKRLVADGGERRQNGVITERRENLKASGEKHSVAGQK